MSVKINYYCVRSIGRDPNNPSDRSTGNPNLVQRLEIKRGGLAGTITNVAKDNYVLEEYEEEEHEDDEKIQD